jgi:hypothetical protein
MQVGTRAAQPLSQATQREVMASLAHQVSLAFRRQDSLLYKQLGRVAYAPTLRTLAECPLVRSELDAVLESLHMSWTNVRNPLNSRRATAQIIADIEDDIRVASAIANAKQQEVLP